MFLPEGSSSFPRHLAKIPVTGTPSPEGTFPGFLFFLIYFTFIGVKVSDPLELELETVVICHVGAGN